MKERGGKGGDSRITKGERVKNVVKLDRGEQRVRKRKRKEKGEGEKEEGREKKYHFLTSQSIAELSLLCLRLQQFPTQFRDPLF